MLLLPEQAILHGSRLIQLGIAYYLGLLYQKVIFNFVINGEILYRIRALLPRSSMVMNLVMYWFEGKCNMIRGMLCTIRLARRA